MMAIQRVDAGGIGAASPAGPVQAAAVLSGPGGRVPDGHLPGGHGRVLQREQESPPPAPATPELDPEDVPPPALPPSLVPIPPPAPTAGTQWTQQAPAASALPFPAPVEPTPHWPRTFGVALPIPEPFLAELGAYRERFGDPLAHAIVAHITLVPPTEVADAASLAAVIEHLADVAAQCAPFRVVLTGVDSFRPVSPVVFVPLSTGEQDVRDIEGLVRRGPLDRELRFPFHPHVTVAHDVAPQWLDEAEATMRTYRAEFEVTALALFENGPDGVWREVRQFVLGPGGASPSAGAAPVATSG